MNDLTVQESTSLITELYNIQTVDEIKAFISKLSLLKDLMVEADTFRAQSIKYAKLEAYALIKAAELGALRKSGVRINRRYETALWLSSLAEEEREKYIAMCDEGMTIDQIWYREHGKERQLEKNLSALNFQKQFIFADLKKNGIVSLSPFAEQAYDTLRDEKLARTIVMGLRNEMLSSGAVGVGDNTLEYILPSASNQGKIQLAIENRIKSIKRDIMSLNKLIAKSSWSSDPASLVDHDGSSEQIMMDLLLACIFVYLGAFPKKSKQDCFASLFYYKKPEKLFRDFLTQFDFLFTTQQ